MSKYVIDKTTLTAIGDAVRDKGGTTELIPVNELADAITNLPSGGGGEVEPVVLSDNQRYGCSGNLSGSYINMFGNTITTKDITNVDNMFFNNAVLIRVPFDINMKANNSSAIDSMFSGATKLEYIPDIHLNQSTSTYYGATSVFYGCENLKQVPYLYGLKPNTLSYFFSGCKRLREIPEDYFDTWDFSKVNGYQYANVTNLFTNCTSLRKIPKKLLSEYLAKETVEKPYYYMYYVGFINTCYSLDELVDLPVSTSTIESNAFSSLGGHNYRLKELTFETNDDGTPKVANWKNQSLNTHSWYFGYCPSGRSPVIDYNSGITADKEVKDNATYQALKNDPDWFTCKIEYSRYNHDSAVNTINSLPDTSAYLATKGGTNTIMFQGNSGSATDGGAINTLTDVEIAVAASKGWTVTLV